MLIEAITINTRLLEGEHQKMTVLQEEVKTPEEMLPHKVAWMAEKMPLKLVEVDRRLGEVQKRRDRILKKMRELNHRERVAACLITIIPVAITREVHLQGRLLQVAPRDTIDHRARRDLQE